jgi:sodium-dependent dicarboxylate transporter 2/3/5
MKLPSSHQLEEANSLAEEATTSRFSYSTAMRDGIEMLRERRWFFIALALGAVLLYLPVPEGLSPTGYTVLVMSIVAIVLFVTEPIPLPGVALMIIVGQVVLLGIDSSEVAQSLMSDSVLFIMGSLMLAVAIVKQKLDRRIAFRIVRLTGTNTANICVGMTTVSAILASVIGEHTVAAMMLPVAMTLIRLTSDNPREVRNLAIVLLFSICYGCAIAGIGTPSGGARNAIMIGFWREFFYDPLDPSTDKYLVDYSTWVAYCYPIFLAQLPLVSLVLLRTFKPEHKHITRAVVKLRAQLAEQGPMRSSDWGAIIIFGLTLIGWIGFSDVIGLGTVAIIGAIAFLVFGLVHWEDMNTNVNWGVILLYGAAISLGIQMTESGAALWVADRLLSLLTPLNADSGVPLWTSISALTTGVTNTMSNGAAVAVLGPITLNLANASGESPLLMGFITSVSSAFAYLTVIGTPACTIVYASGYLKPSHFLKAGFKMILISTAVLILAAYFYWPLLGL